MEKLMLIRHGTVYGGDRKRYIGVTDLPLCDDAEAQAEAAARFCEFADVVFSGTLIRSSEFAAMICSASGAKQQRDTRLNEINMGEWEGRSFDEIDTLFPDRFDERGRNLAKFTPPDGESFERVQERALEFVKEHKHLERLVAVTHLGVIRCLLCAAEGKPLDNLMEYHLNYGDSTEIEGEKLKNLLNYNVKPGQ